MALSAQLGNAVAGRADSDVNEAGESALNNEWDGGSEDGVGHMPTTFSSSSAKVAWAGDAEAPEELQTRHQLCPVSKLFNTKITMDAKLV